jgi:hypothetical protein
MIWYYDYWERWFSILKIDAQTGTLFFYNKEAFHDLAAQFLPIVSPPHTTSSSEFPISNQYFEIHHHHH